MSKSKTIKGNIDALFSSAVILPRRSFLSAAATISGASIIGTSETIAKDTKSAVVESLPVTDKELAYMKQAIELMHRAGVVDKTGGPFGAVIVRDGQILSAEGNSVLRDNDPTGHAEVNAIRAACKKVGSPHLTGATMFTSCECCPMCYATSYWAQIDKVYYAASWQDYKQYFDDGAINKDMCKPKDQRKIRMTQIMQKDAQNVWAEYGRLSDRKGY